jgi:hypothetical protein
VTYADHVVAARIRLGLVAVVLSPVGPRCTVRTARGEILHGYRVPDDYPGPELVHRGHPVRARFVDAKDGSPTEDWLGQQLVAKGDQGTTRPVVAESYRLEVEPCEPPPLTPPLPYGGRRVAG